MDSITNRRFEMLKRVNQFGVTYAADFPETGLGAQLFQRVAATVTTLDTLSVSHVSELGAARSGVTTKAAARQTLEEAMLAIQRTARSLVYDLPGLRDKFPPPRGLSDQALLTTARAYAQAVNLHQTRFVQHALATDFHAQLLQHITTFAAAVQEKQTAVNAQRTARAGFQQQLAEGIQTVRQLDALIRNTFQRDSVALSEWERAARITHRNRPAADDDTAENEPPVTASTAK